MKSGRTCAPREARALGTLGVRGLAAPRGAQARKARGPRGKRRGELPRMGLRRDSGRYGAPRHRRALPVRAGAALRRRHGDAQGQAATAVLVATRVNNTDLSQDSKKREGMMGNGGNGKRTLGKTVETVYRLCVYGPEQEPTQDTLDKKAELDRLAKKGEKIDRNDIDAIDRHMEKYENAHNAYIASKCQRLEGGWEGSKDSPDRKEGWFKAKQGFVFATVGVLLAISNEFYEGVADILGIPFPYAASALGLGSVYYFIPLILHITFLKIGGKWWMQRKVRFSLFLLVIGAGVIGMIAKEICKW